MRFCAVCLICFIRRVVYGVIVSWWKGKKETGCVNRVEPHFLFSTGKKDKKTCPDWIPALLYWSIKET